MQFYNSVFLHYDAHVTDTELEIQYHNLNSQWPLPETFRGSTLGLQLLVFGASWPLTPSMDLWQFGAVLLSFPFWTFHPELHLRRALTKPVSVRCRQKYRIIPNTITSIIMKTTCCITTCKINPQIENCQNRSERKSPYTYTKSSMESTKNITCYSFIYAWLK